MKPIELSELITAVPLIVVVVVAVWFTLITILMPVFIYYGYLETKRSRKLLEKIQFDLQRIRNVATGGK